MKDALMNVKVRQTFADAIYKKMKKNKKLWVVTADMGYGMWDRVKADFPDRFLNTGASEQAMIGICVGLALEGKIPIAFSITSFLIYRPFETIRNYLQHEKIPVKLVGAGRDKDYLLDGYSHWAPEDREIFKIFKNIHSVWIDDASKVPGLVDKMIASPLPWYVNLKR
jgi:transketolase